MADQTIGSARVGDSDIELTRMAKFLVWASMVSVLFVNQIAYNIGQFPAALDLPCYALITAYLLASGYAKVSMPILQLFVAVIAMAAFRIPLLPTTTQASWSSLVLLAAGYASFAVRLSPRSGLSAIQQYILDAYVTTACIIAAVGTIQIVAVNATRLKELQNIYFVLPEAIRGAGTYVFAREAGGGLAKANGYFLRESAELSSVTALAFLAEYFDKRRPFRLFVLAMGLAASISGSGVIALAAGFLLPKSVGRIPIALATACGAMLLLYALYSLDNPVLNLWFGRLTEFGTPGSSAYARFVAPWEMVQRTFNDGIAATWFGNGPGSFFRMLAEFRSRYEISDPTWAKLIYEYGLAGFIFVTLIVIIRLYSSSLRVELCNFMLFSWLVFPSVLKPTTFLIMWLVTLAPARRNAPPPRHSPMVQRSV
ncbi:hypothetical protein [Bradyrhizobium sp. RDM4]|uniref:hypothetical protein n=1 Tax=Bradyrhizobium sp. RDM4 TaxID=3378765 RepID=UPI0038FCA1DE